MAPFSFLWAVSLYLNFGQKGLSPLLLINFQGKVKEISIFFVRLFFLPYELHRLAAAMQCALAGNEHFDFIPTDFTNVNLTDFVGHIGPPFQFMGRRFSRIDADKIL
jgi:hypothetical protein